MRSSHMRERWRTMIGSDATSHIKVSWSSWIADTRPPSWYRTTEPHFCDSLIANVERKREKERERGREGVRKRGGGRERERKSDRLQIASCTETKYRCPTFYNFMRFSKKNSTLHEDFCMRRYSILSYQFYLCLRLSFSPPCLSHKRIERRNKHFLLSFSHIST